MARKGKFIFIQGSPLLDKISEISIGTILLLESSKNTLSKNFELSWITFGRKDPLPIILTFLPKIYF